MVAGKAMNRYASGLLLQQVVVGVFMPKVTETINTLAPRSQLQIEKSAHTSSIKALSIGTQGNVHAYNFSEPRVLEPSTQARRQVRRQAKAAEGERENGEVLLELKEYSGSIKLAVVCIACIVALAGFCYLAVWLVWTPISAIFEERAYEQAAKQALLEAAPPKAPAEGSLDAPLATSLEQNAANREEQLDLAWKKFLDNPLLRISSTNYLAMLLRELLGKRGTSFQTQIEDLFNGLCEDGADSIKRADVEKVCENISGKMINLHAKESISEVEYKVECECSMAVATVEEDYDWLFDNYDTVFPADMPCDRKSFAGLVSLVVVWNCVRTLHTARHMSIEHHTNKNQLEELSGKVAVDIKIDTRSNKDGYVPLEAHASISATDKTGSSTDAQPKGEDGQPDDGGNGLASRASASGWEDEELAP